MDGEAWWAAVHGVAKSWTRLSDFTFTFHFHPLEKEKATHSSTLAWKIPWMEEPGLSLPVHLTLPFLGEGFYRVAGVFEVRSVGSIGIKAVWGVGI